MSLSVAEQDARRARQAAAIEVVRAAEDLIDTGMDAALLRLRDAVTKLREARKR